MNLDEAIAEPERRAYRSPVREQQARATRARILEAAARLFAANGYAGTSLAAIGRAAGVATETVAANGPKRALLIAAFELTLGGREGADMVSAREEMQRLLRDADVDRLLDVVGDQVVAGAARTVGLWRALSAAAAADAEVAVLYDALSGRRRADARFALDVLAERGVLRPGADVQRLADTVALLNGMDAYQLFVREFGWTEAELKQWWIDATRRLVFAP